jgi:hypothetical protein
MSGGSSSDRSRVKGGQAVARRCVLSLQTPGQRDPRVSRSLAARFCAPSFPILFSNISWLGSRRFDLSVSSVLDRVAAPDR